MLTPHSLMRAPLRPEARLLFLTAWGPAADAHIRDLAPQIRNWPWFIAIAELERATRVVWQRLSALGVLPQSQYGVQLEQMATIAAFQAEHLRARLHETLAALAQVGIDVVLLKGAALASTIYPSFIDRPMGDLDLLVAPDAADRAHLAVRDAGWTWDSVTFPRSRYVGHHHLPPLDDAAGTGVRLELHTGIAIEGHPFAINRDDLRARSRTVQIVSVQASAPCQEHLLLHECVHFAWSHVLSFGAWRTARDVQFMATQGSIDWDMFVAEANRNRADSCAYWTLALSRLLAGAPLPDDVLRRLRPTMSEFTERLLERHFMYHLLPIQEDWPSQRLRKRLWELAIQPQRYGHGPRRPWELDERTEPGTAGRSVGVRRFERLARLGAWARYARALLATAPTKAQS